MDQASDFFPLGNGQCVAHCGDGVLPYSQVGQFSGLKPVFPHFLEIQHDLELSVVGALEITLFARAGQRHFGAIRVLVGNNPCALHEIALAGFVREHPIELAVDRPAYMGKIGVGAAQFFR
jgi:hypothetical protein